MHGVRQKVPMSQASLHIVPLFSAGRGCFSPGSPQHALSCTNTAGGSAAEKGGRVEKPKALRNPAVGRPSVICFSASLISFTEHPLGNAGLVYGFTEAES